MLYFIQTTKNAQTKPTKKPIKTCERECWRKIMRAVPTIPAKRMTRESHQVGLKEKPIE